MRKTLPPGDVQPGQIQAFEQTPLVRQIARPTSKNSTCDIGDRVEQDKPVADLWIPELQDEARQKEAMVVYAKAGVQQATAAVHAAEKAVATARPNSAKPGPARSALWPSMSGGSRSTRGSWNWRPAAASTAGWSTKRRTN